MADQDRERYPRAAVRWLGRLALERPALELADLRLAVCALDALPVWAEVLPALRALTHDHVR